MKRHTHRRRFPAIFLSSKGTYALQVAGMTMREVYLMLAADSGAQAVALLHAGDSAVMVGAFAKAAWGCALDALGWRENGHGIVEAVDEQQIVSVRSRHDAARQGHRL